MTKSIGIQKAVLMSFIERIERMMEEKKNAADDIKDIYAEAKSAGFDRNVLRELIKLRAKDEDTVTEFFQVLNTYAEVTGLNLGLTPLEAYIDREEKLRKAVSDLEVDAKNLH